MLEAIRATGMPLTQAIEDALALWLARQKRKAKTDPLARLRSSTGCGRKAGRSAPATAHM